ncbi:transcription factor S [Candidatus Woesearchaeota archaeon]|nr:transcription factor S [Candidatus Woesearchaeota archaeon]
MQFCPKCGAILVPKRMESGKMQSCSCGYKIKNKQNFVVKEKVEKKGKIEIIGQKLETLPKVKEECPKCKNKLAYYWTLQTRAGDEAETRFFECVKCQHRWRSYT